MKKWKGLLVIISLASLIFYIGYFTGKISDVNAQDIPRLECEIAREKKIKKAFQNAEEIIEIQNQIIKELISENKYLAAFIPDYYPRSFRGIEGFILSDSLATLR